MNGHTKIFLEPESTTGKIEMRREKKNQHSNTR